VEKNLFEKRSWPSAKDIAGDKAITVIIANTRFIVEPLHLSKLFLSKFMTK